jgi:NurA-like 5'-3' nuclease
VDGLRVSVRTVPLESTVDLTTSISVLNAKLDVHREKSDRVSVRFVDPESTRRVLLHRVRTVLFGSTLRVMRTRIAVHVSLLIRESVLHIPRSASQLG